MCPSDITDHLIIYVTPTGGTYFPPDFWQAPSDIIDHLTVYVTAA